MKKSGNGWIAGLVFILILIAVPVWYFTRPAVTAAGHVVDSPWDNVPRRAEPVDHSSLFEQTFTTGQEVTQACLECHEEAAGQIMGTVHWTWEAPPVPMAGRAEPVAHGKKNAINNFCIGIQGNWASCTACHAGYGWEDETFDFSNGANVDCLVCHDRSGGYVKGQKGLPAEGVDLLAAARSVGLPGRENCGGCHFRGGGGNAGRFPEMNTTDPYSPRPRAKAMVNPVRSAGSTAGRTMRRKMWNGPAPRISAASSRSRCTSISAGCTERTTNGSPISTRATTTPSQV